MIGVLGGTYASIANIMTVTGRFENSSIREGSVEGDAATVHPLLRNAAIKCVVFMCSSPSACYRCK